MATVLSAVVVVLGLLVGLRLLLDYAAQRDATRHGWRMELVKARADAWKADNLDELRQRVQRLELKVTR